MKIQLEDAAKVKEEKRKLEEEKQRVASLENELEEKPGAADRVHAPSFETFVSLPNAEEKMEIEAPFEFASGVGLADMLLGTHKSFKHGKNKKKKAQAKKAAAKKIKSVSEIVSKSMKENGYAVIDNFIGTDMVQDALDEIKSLDDFYTASEIWVGKDKSGSVGAHINAPNVRGDKVLWMCGGHLRGSKSKDRGKMAPCDPKVVVNATLKDGGVAKIDASKVYKYAATQQMIKAMDAFVITELREVLPQLEKVYERSDLHMAVCKFDIIFIMKYLSLSSLILLTYLFFY